MIAYWFLQLNSIASVGLTTALVGLGLHWWCGLRIALLVTIALVVVWPKWRVLSMLSLGGLGGARQL